MKRWEAWAVHGSLLLVGGTGLLYAWMRYLLAPADPYAVVNHPLQPALQHLHVLAAPLLVFAVGLIWRAHVWKHWRNGVPQRRRSGLSLLLSLTPMVASGYLIQTTVGDGWRTAWVAIHLVTSAVFLLAYGGHLVAALRKRTVDARSSAALEALGRAEPHAAAPSMRRGRQRRPATAGLPARSPSESESLGVVDRVRLRT